ncbi:MAG TPA: VWA domain-containing protein [Chitinivibrionales bacterium]|nr:VWA domain-containing protein [Chitinivibrionales bacterium]
MNHSLTKNTFGRVCLMIPLLFTTLFAVQRCELTFSACPETFNGDTIVVPDDVTKLNALVHVCIEGPAGVPSILFVIDNTGSMKGPNGNDPTGARFNVAKDLLDTILAKQPNAEVGIEVFREHLYFDTTTTQYYYTQYFETVHPTLDSEPRQAYLPFLGLAQTYGSKRGIDIIKDVLMTDATGGDLVYKPSWTEPTSGETNINGALKVEK